MDTAQDEKDTPQAKVDETPPSKVASPETKEPSPRKPLQPFTEEQQERVDKLIQLASIKGGRDRKAVEVERDTLKTKVEDYEKKIVAIEEERASLQKLIDEDPDKLSLVTKDKSLREREKKLQDSLNAHEVDKKSYAQLIKDAKQHDTVTKIYLISEQYEGGDADKLTEACEKYGLETEGEIKSMAETLWSKKEESETPPIDADSGKTSGGAISDEQATLNRLYPSMAKK